MTANNPVVVNIADVQRRQRSGVAIGFFDGVHRGHRAVIEGCETVLTFDRHPLSVLAPARAPKLLMDLERRIATIATLGVSEIVLIPFDRMWATLGAEEFIHRVLLHCLRPECVSVGANFRFGVNAQGSTETLCVQPDLQTRVVGLMTAGGEVVSSSRIRALVARGDVEQAAELMCGALEHTATKGSDDRWHVHPGFAVPATGSYQALIDGQVASVRIGSGGHELVTSIGYPADRMTIRFLRRLD